MIVDEPAEKIMKLTKSITKYHQGEHVSAAVELFSARPSGLNCLYYIMSSINGIIIKCQLPIVNYQLLMNSQKAQKSTIRQEIATREYVSTAVAWSFHTKGHKYETSVILCLPGCARKKGLPEAGRKGS